MQAELPLHQPMQETQAAWQFPLQLLRSSHGSLPKQAEQQASEQFEALSANAFSGTTRILAPRRVIPRQVQNHAASLVGVLMTRLLPLMNGDACSRGASSSLSILWSES